MPALSSIPPTRATTVEGMGQRLGIGWNVISMFIVGILGRVLGDESLWATNDGSICMPYKLFLQCGSTLFGRSRIRPVSLGEATTSDL